LTDVLGRRLTLAYKQKEKPTNMHKLMIAYYQQAKNPIWHKSSIKRGFYQEKITNDFFKPLGILLKQQREKLAENYSSISQERHCKFGAYWFINGDTYIEVVEELSLFDVFNLIPLGGLNAKTSPPIFTSVIESLNERYGFLRSCGLPPSIWLTCPISNGNLKDLKQLRIQANLLIQEGGKNTIAYEKAFIKLQAQNKKFIGFVSFNEFCQSHLGQITLHLKLETPETQSPPGLDDNTLKLPSLYPEDFNPVTAYVFQLIMTNEIIEIHGQGKKSLSQHPQFLQLASQHSNYANLSKSTLIKTVNHQLAIILDKHQIKGE